MQIDSIPFTADSQGLPADSYAYHIGRSNENPVNNANKLEIYDGKDGAITSNPLYVDIFGRFLNVNGQQVTPWINETAYAVTVLSPAGGVLNAIENWVSDSVSSSSIQASVVDATINNLENVATGAKYLDLSAYDTIYIQSENSGWEDSIPGPQDGFYAHNNGTTGAISTGNSDLFYDSVGTGFSRGTLQRVDESVVSGNTAAIVQLTSQNIVSGLNVAYASIATNTVAEGVCTDSTKTTLITAVSATIDISAVIGTGGNAARPTAVSLTADTDYHVFIVTEADGSNPKYAYDTSLTAVNALSAWSTETGETYTLYRRIRSIKTNGSSEIIEDFQRKNKIYRALPVELSTAMPTVLTDLACAVPLGIECDVVLQAMLNTGTAGDNADRTLSIKDLNASAAFLVAQIRASTAGDADANSTEFSAITDVDTNIEYIFNSASDLTATISQRYYIDEGL